MRGEVPKSSVRVSTSLARTRACMAAAPSSPLTTTPCSVMSSNAGALGEHEGATFRFGDMDGDRRPIHDGEREALAEAPLKPRLPVGAIEHAQKSRVSTSRAEPTAKYGDINSKTHMRYVMKTAAMGRVPASAVPRLNAGTLAVLPRRVDDSIGPSNDTAAQPIETTQEPQYARSDSNGRHSASKVFLASGQQGTGTDPMGNYADRKTACQEFGDAEATAGTSQPSYPTQGALPNPGSNKGPDAELRAAIKAAVDAGQYERAAMLLDVLKATPVATVLEIARRRG